MRKVLLLIWLIPLIAHGQTSRRGMLSLMGSYGVNGTILRPRVTVIGGPYQLKAEQIDNPECYDDNGRLVDCNGRNHHIGLGVQYRLSNRSKTAGWMLYTNVALQSQTFMLNYPANRRFSIPVACTPSIRRHLSSSGLGVTIGRFWATGQSDTQLFVRIGAMMARDFEYLRGLHSVKLPDRNAVQYVSGGSGTIIQMYSQVPRSNWLITPEIGLTAQHFPLELAASIQVPVIRQTVFSELHSFIENNRIVGQNRVDYTNAVFNLTARIGFNLLSSTKKERYTQSKVITRDRNPVPRQPPGPINSDPAPVHTVVPNRFDGATSRSPMQLLVYFDLEKADLKPASFVELDELSLWLKANPTVQIRLEGHTDLIGDEAENMRLSLRRVVTVKDYLTMKGIASYRVEVKGYGETRPLNRNCPPPNYCLENRRVEMVILSR